jgi:hypothetical protein
MKVTIQYFDGCPHWQLADERVRNVLEAMSTDDVSLEYQLIDSPAMADRVGFLGSPTILIDGRDPFATGAEHVGMSCRVYRTEEGVQGAPTEVQLRTLISRSRSSTQP